MYLKLDNESSRREHQLTRRTLLLGSSAVAGAAAIAAIGGGLAPSGAHAAPANANESASAVAPVALYRLSKQDYLYLTKPQEVQQAQSQYGYKLDGVVGHVFMSPVKGTVLVWRWSNGKDRYYTADASESPSGYTRDVSQFYAYPNAASLVSASVPQGYTPTPFYRLNNGSIHFYTADNQELVNAQRQNKYFVEFTAFYMLA